MIKNPKLKRLVEAVLDVFPDAQQKGEQNAVVSFLTVMGRNVYNDLPAVVATAQKQLLNDQVTKQSKGSVKDASNELSGVGETGETKPCSDCPGGTKGVANVPAINDAVKQAVEAMEESDSEGDLDFSGFQSVADKIGEEDIKEASPDDIKLPFAGTEDKQLPKTPEECDTLEELQNYYGLDTPRKKNDIIAQVRQDLNRLEVDYDGRVRSAKGLIEALFNGLKKQN